jgi:hypothetical protein
MRLLEQGEWLTIFFAEEIDRCVAVGEAFSWLFRVTREEPHHIWIRQDGKSFQNGGYN